MSRNITIYSTITVLLLCFLLFGCSPTHLPDSAPVTIPIATPTDTSQPLPSIGGWYEYSYTTQDYLQTTYTVYLDFNDGIEIKAGLHTWNNNKMQEQHCTNIHSDTYLTFSVLNTAQVSIGGTFYAADGGYSNETFTIERGGFLVHPYVDSEGHLSTFILEPSTEDRYKSDIAALHAQAPDCTASDF